MSFDTKPAQDIQRVSDSDKLLSGLAYELQGNLVFARTTIELLKEQIAEADSSQSEHLRRLGVMLDRSLRLIEGYLRSGEAPTRLQFEPINLRASLEAACHSVSPLAEREGCHLYLTGPELNIPVMAQREVVEEAFVCLLDNVVHTTNSEVVTIDLKRRADRQVVMVHDQIQVRRGRHRAVAIGTARQPSSQLAGSSGIGLALAEQLLSLLAAEPHFYQRGIDRYCRSALKLSEQTALV